MVAHARRLGGVEREFRAVQQALGGGAVTGGDGHADGGAAGEVEALDDEGTVQRILEAGGEADGVRRAFDLVLDDEEAVAADAADQVDLADGLAQRLGHGADQPVADVIAMGVVDGLERAEVDIVDREAEAGRGQPAEPLGQPLQQGGPVQQAGQLVALGQELGAHLRHLALDRQEFGRLVGGLLLLGAQPERDRRAADGEDDQPGEHDADGGQQIVEAGALLRLVDERLDHRGDVGADHHRVIGLGIDRRQQRMVAVAQRGDRAAAGHHLGHPSVDRIRVRKPAGLDLVGHQRQMAVSSVDLEAEHPRAAALLGQKGGALRRGGRAGGDLAEVVDLHGEMIHPARRGDLGIVADQPFDGDVDQCQRGAGQQQQHGEQAEEEMHADLLEGHDHVPAGTVRCGRMPNIRLRERYLDKFGGANVPTR